MQPFQPAVREFTAEESHDTAQMLLFWTHVLVSFLEKLHKGSCLGGIHVPQAKERFQLFLLAFSEILWIFHKHEPHLLEQGRKLLLFS